MKTVAIWILIAFCAGLSSWLGVKIGSHFLPLPPRELSVKLEGCEAALGSIPSPAKADDDLLQGL